MADAPEEPREEPSFEPSSKENSSTNSSDAAIEIIVKPNEQPSPKLFLNNTKEFIQIPSESLATNLKDLGDNGGLKRLNMFGEVEGKGKIGKLPTGVHVDGILSTITNCDFLVELNITDVYLLNNTLRFGDMPLIKSLTIVNCSLRLLHPSVGRLKSLKYMSIRNNRVCDLPMTFRFLQNLTHFDLSLNLFRSLPSSLFHLQSLKTITGFHDNLFDQNPSWNKEENLNIISIAPLKKTLLAKNNEGSTSGEVLTLKSFAIKNAVGVDIWSVPLPEQYRMEIASLKGNFDVCECCGKCVQKITDTQETTGYLIKMCMAVFLGTRNVPFRFYTCSLKCSDKTVGKLTEYQKKLIDECSMSTDLPEIVLKEPHCKPFQHKDAYLNGTTITTNTEASQGESKKNGGKCILS